MKALFLVGGDGARLRPLTEYIPKPMLPVMGRPLLERTFERLRRMGVEEILLSAHPAQQNLAAHILDSFSTDTSLTYIAEHVPFGAGGAIKNAGPLLDDTFFVIDAGVLYDISLPAMLRRHRETGADATLAGIRAEGNGTSTILAHGEDGRLTAVHPNRRPDAPLPHGTEPQQYSQGHAAAGVYLFEPEALEHIGEVRPYSAERELLPALLESGKTLIVHSDESYHRKLSTPTRYVEVHRDCFDGLCGVARDELGGSNMFVSDTARLHPSVHIDTPVYIGKNAVVEKQCALHGDVTVGDGAHIANDCSLLDTIVWPGTYVPGHTQLRHTVAAEIKGQLVRFPYESLGVEAKERWQ